MKVIFGRGGATVMFAVWFQAVGACVLPGVGSGKGGQGSH